jgi:hypothetical protein
MRLIVVTMRLLTLLAAVQTTIFAQTANQKSPVALSKQTFAFINVSVLPLDKEILLSNQTVIIKNGRIAAIGPAEKSQIPKDAIRIDGQNKFLLPGLSDMHVHLPYNPDDINDTPAFLKLFVANGVTTVLNLLGVPAHVALRERIATGEELGPIVYTSGFYVNEPFVRTPEEVEAEVTKQKRAGYDVIKIHGNLTRESYHRLFEVSRREGIRVIGHAPRNLGYEPMLEERQDAVAHAEEYIVAYFGFGRRCCTAEEIGPMVRYISEATSKAGTWVVPTLTIFKGIAPQIKDLDSVLKRPEMKYVPHGIAAEWQPGKNRYQKNKPEEIPTLEGVYGLQEYLVNGFKKAGVRLLAGSDTPVTAAVIPGFSLHEELANLVAAGLTPYEALRTATYNPADFLGALDEFGTVTVGRRADLLLIDQNPLQSVKAVSEISGVMIRGRWLPRKELKKMLDGLAAPH